MTDNEFDEFLAESLDALERKQGALTFAVRQLGAIGAYKAPGANSDLYLAILKVTRPDTVSQR